MPAKVIPIAAANPYRIAARQAKALKLYGLLRDNGLAHMVGMMQEEHWVMLAQAAGVKPPSSVTRALVMEMCGEYEQGA